MQYTTKLAISILLTSIFAAHAELPPIRGFIDIATCIKKKYPVTFLLEDKKASKQFMLSLLGGMVVNEGGIVTADGEVLTDTETYKQDQHRLVKGKIPTWYASFDGTLAVISSPGQENWYHWLLQVLPRLKILHTSGIAFDKIYVTNLTYSWQKESLKIVLDALGISEDVLRVFEDDVAVKAKTLLVPSVPFIPSKNRKAIPTWLKSFLRNTFLKGDSPPDMPRKIYISRSKARCRRILNEDAFLKFLEKQGFTRVYLEDMSPLYQAQLFNTAEIIIGPHGSGFANVVFSQPGTTVIEIDHGLEGEQRSYYKRFTRLMGCEYYPFYADAVKEEDLDKDLDVDIRLFEAFLSRVIAKPSES